MTPEQKSALTQWIAALSSGRYAQGHKQLRCNSNGRTVFCCLGVLCEINHIPYRFRQDGDPRNGYEFAQEYGGPGRDNDLICQGMPNQAWAQQVTGLDWSVLTWLAATNDCSSTFGPVIEILRAELDA